MHKRFSVCPGIAAGAANINYLNRLDHPIVRLGTGVDGWGRFLAAASPGVGNGYLLGAIEANRDDGPWVRPDHYGKLNGVLRYSRGDRLATHFSARP